MACCALLLLTGSPSPAQELNETALPDAPFQLEQGWHALLNGRDLSGWHEMAAWRGDPKQLNQWLTTSSVQWSRLGSPTSLNAKREPGPVIMNGIPAHTNNLISDESFGDVELYVEFQIAKGSNSGVYLEGLYEVQIFDSFGVDSPMTTGDAGAIYERWGNDRGFEGSAPLKNASRRPGEWQSYHIWFRTPHFENGRRVSEAEFLKVVYNGVIVQSHYKCSGPTRSGLERAESATGPLMLQGDHGPVAFRNIYIRPLREAGAVHLR